MDTGNPDWFGIAVACGCGLLIGVERERRKRDQGYLAFAGVRSFAVAAIAGALAQATSSPLLVVAGALLVGGLSVAAYYKSRATDPGITTDLALFLTYLIGVTAMLRPALAAGTAALLAVLLAARNRLHRFSSEMLTQRELEDGLILASVALVILPLAADRPMAVLGGMNPRSIWKVVVLLMFVQTAGHVALRLWGARLGLALSGLASGFVTSAGTIAVMGARARAEPALLNSCVAAGLMSCGATFVQLGLVAAGVYPGILMPILPVLGAALGAVIVATLPWLRGGPASTGIPADGERIFDTRKTIVFALLMTGVSAALGWISGHAGPAITSLVGAGAGFADVHAAAAAVFALGRDGRLESGTVVMAMLFAISTNTLTKIAASALGGWAYCWRVSAGLLLVLAGAWLGWWWLPAA